MAYFARLVRMCRAPVARMEVSPLKVRADGDAERTEGADPAEATGTESTAVDTHAGSPQNAGTRPERAETMLEEDSNREQDAQVPPPSLVSEKELTREILASDVGTPSLARDNVSFPRTGSDDDVPSRDADDTANQGYRAADSDQREPTVVISADEEPALVTPRSSSVEQESNHADQGRQPDNARHMQLSAKSAKPEAPPGDAKTVEVSAQPGIDSATAPTDSMETALRSVRHWLTEPVAVRDFEANDSAPLDVLAHPVGSVADLSTAEQEPTLPREKGRLAVRATPFDFRHAKAKPRGEGAVLSIGTINVTVEAATPESSPARKPVERSARPIVSEGTSVSRGTHLRLLRHYLRL